ERPMNGARLSILCVLILGACGTPTEPDSGLLPVCWWSGETVLQVRDRDVILFVTCGAATFARPALDRGGAFQTDGHLKISIGPPPPLPLLDSPGAPATFTGQLSGSMLTLTMNSAQLTHTFTFHFDGG